MIFPGERGYTINAKTGKIDSWTVAGHIPGEKKMLVVLTSGKKTCVLPKRCVFPTKEAAQRVLKTT